jgi:hypothetical protein
MNNKSNVLVAALIAYGMIANASATTPMKTASTATNQRCNELIVQFDSAKSSHMSAKNFNLAVSAREKGAAECKAGEYNKGVASLHDALRDIGVKPLTRKT